MILYSNVDIESHRSGILERDGLSTFMVQRLGEQVRNSEECSIRSKVRRGRFRATWMPRAVGCILQRNTTLDTFMAQLREHVDNSEERMSSKVGRSRT